MIVCAFIGLAIWTIGYAETNQNTDNGLPTQRKNILPPTYQFPFTSKYTSPASIKEQFAAPSVMNNMANIKKKKRFTNRRSFQQTLSDKYKIKYHPANTNKQTNNSMRDILHSNGKVKRYRSTKEDNQYTTLSSKPNNRTIKQLPIMEQLIRRSIHQSSKCILQSSRQSVSRFRHITYYGELSYVYLKLIPTGNVTIKGSRIIVGENLWVWTYYGKKGGIKFLSWPIEFGIWSLGLLLSFTYGPMDIELERISGDCTNLTVGEKHSDLAISKALLNLTLAMMALNEERYGPSFWCYKKRMIINPYILYKLCKHLVCPLEALEYSCCTYAFNEKLLHREVDCHKPYFKYDMMWWTCPMLIAVILFAFLPLLLLNVANAVSLKTDQMLNQHCKAQLEHTQCKDMDTNIVFLDETDHVTLVNTLFIPFGKLGSVLKSKSSRIVRFLFPFLSLSFIGLQILLDYGYLYQFVLTSIDKGVPLGFRSMISGYRKSSQNFLPYLGGPFIALFAYLLVTCMLITIPSSLAILLETGLPNNDYKKSLSPLCVGLKQVERFGSIRICRHRHYLKVYKVFLGQFYMLLNKNFWIHIFSRQIERGKSCCTSIIRFLLIPFYTTFCVVELVLSIALYGFPITSFGLTIIRAYCGRLRRCHAPTLFWKGNILMCQIVLVICVVYFLFMFGTIFLDAILFISRVFIFTYTGVVVYPKLSYGYIIFTFTVIYYLWDCVQNFSLIYRSLLKDTIKVCGKIQRANDVNKLVIKVNDCKGVKESLFEHVIESICPRRKQVFVSGIKLATILAIIGLSVNLLFKTDKLRELHIIMHVGTALFICAFPKILKSMCKNRQNKFRHKRFMQDIETSVKNYLGYFIDISDSDPDSE